MHGFGRIAIALAAGAALTFGVGATVNAADAHTGGHTSAGETAHSDSGKKGPKYMGGGRGSEHSSQVHEGGTHHHDSGSAGSKSVERRIFSSDIGGKGKGPKYMEGGAAGTDHRDGETEHTH